jgi:integrin alpha 10
MSYAGYSVSSMLLQGGRRLFLSGAPRFKHRGKVIAFQLKKDGAVRVAHSLQGEQVWNQERVGFLDLQGLPG